MFFLVYARLYAAAFVNALGSIAKNPWTLLLPMGLFASWGLLAGLVAPLGFVGGIIIAFARSAALSVYSYFLAQLVARSVATPRDLKTSLTVYLWSWVNLFFVLWVVDLGLSIALANNPSGAKLQLIVSLMELVVLNACPEVVYQKGSSGGLETITRSVDFLQENWIEWFVPNGLIIAGYAAVSLGLLTINLPLGLVLTPVLGGAFAHLYMVFRGFLFEALDGSTHRQRMYRYRGER